jgi:hypothetical protein
LNETFGSLESLSGLEKAMQDFDAEIQMVDSEIKQVIREQALAADQARQHVQDINAKSQQMIQTIQTLKQSTGTAEVIVKQNCAEIKRLDTAKRNITFSITSLKRLIMLIQAIEQFSLACMDKRYREAAHLIEATSELLEYFKDYYHTTPEIKQLKDERDRLIKELRLQVLEDFNSMKTNGIKEQLSEACLVMQAIGGQALNDLRQWYS